MSEHLDRRALEDEISAARRSLVSVLASLEPKDWDAPSLCDEWRVRDVVGHLVHQYDLYRAPYPRAAFFRSGLRINRFLASEAIRAAQGRSPDDLLAAIEQTEFERTITWRLYPGRHFALSEFVIHTQDMTRPLGIAHVPASGQLVFVAGIYARPARMNPFRPRLPRTRFEATDVDWTSGDGPVARGPLEAIVMTLAGRRAAVADLTGDGVVQLERALSSSG